MKFTPSPIAGGLSGSAGSLVASRNRFGQYFRVKVDPVNPNTIRQQAVRTFFTNLVTAWIDVLTPNDRANWEAYADQVPILGETLTGQNHYIRSNVPRLQSGGSRVDAAPVVFNTGAPITSIQLFTDGDPNVFGVNLAVDALAITALSDATFSGDGDVLFYAGTAINVTRNFFKGPYQLMAVAPALDGVGGASFQQLFTALLSANGDPIVDQNRGMRFRVMYDDGRLSDSFNLLATVTADSA